MQGVNRLVRGVLWAAAGIALSASLVMAAYDIGVRSSVSGTRSESGTAVDAPVGRDRPDQGKRDRLVQVSTPGPAPHGSSTGGDDHGVERAAAGNHPLLDSEDGAGTGEGPGSGTGSGEQPAEGNCWTDSSGPGSDGEDRSGSDSGSDSRSGSGSGRSGGEDEVDC